MYLRTLPGKTLADIRNEVETDEGTVIQTLNSEVAVDLLAEDPVISLGTVEVPATPEGIIALGEWLDVPKPFVKRMDPSLRQTVFSHLLQHTGGNGAFVYTGEGLKEVREPNQKVIPVKALIDAAAKVIDPTAPVVEWWQNSSEFRLDVIVPENFDKGIGGDREVGDLSAAGVRLFQNRQQNLAPTVQPYQFRYICTNGMVTSADGLKVDARGGSVEEVLAEFEAAADRAFKRVESDMAAFYAMRSERVENPERVLLRLGTEAGLPTRTIQRLQERVPIMLQESGETEATMFDLVNLITNQANDPTLKRAGARTALESVGGVLVTEHAERCRACSSRLVH